MNHDQMLGLVLGWLHHRHPDSAVELQGYLQERATAAPVGSQSRKDLHEVAEWIGEFVALRQRALDAENERLAA